MPSLISAFLPGAISSRSLTLIPASSNASETVFACVLDSIFSPAFTIVISFLVPSKTK
ncbi:conserved protein of unknown function [Listeria monocytogenes]|nr:conserved protein of unknown function [Listeria monocytogenes]